jgi:hypothetical protein
MSITSRAEPGTTKRLRSSILFLALCVPIFPFPAAASGATPTFINSSSFKEYFNCFAPFHLESNDLESYRSSVRELALAAQEQVASMFDEAFAAYIKYAFPRDGLLASNCTGVDTQGGHALTVIDALDTLALLGRHDDFRKYAKWVVKNIQAKKDVDVSVFEVNIRIVGGLISAHFMYEEGVVAFDPVVHDYQGELLQLASEFADCLLKAFKASPTGIPYGTVNMVNGVGAGEIDIAATASATTFALEFTNLSAITGKPKYEAASRTALRAIFKYMTPLKLVGNHINITSGEWTIPNRNEAAVPPSWGLRS